MAFLLYFASHWVLVIIAVLVVAALGAAAFFLKNWKMALAAIIVAIFGFAYQGAVTSGIKLQMAKDAAEQMEILQGRIKALGDLAIKHAAQANADAAVIEELESKASETPKNDGACLDRAARDRVHSIGTTIRKPVAASPGGPAGLLSKGSR